MQQTCSAESVIKLLEIDSFKAAIESSLPVKVAEKGSRGSSSEFGDFQTSVQQEEPAKNNSDNTGTANQIECDRNANKREAESSVDNVSSFFLNH